MATNYRTSQPSRRTVAETDDFVVLSRCERSTLFRPVMECVCHTARRRVGLLDIVRRLKDIHFTHVAARIEQSN